MNEKQKAGMIRFHKLAEKAYRDNGQIKKAEEARKMRERLEGSNKNAN